MEALLNNRGSRHNGMGGDPRMAMLNGLPSGINSQEEDPVMAMLNGPGGGMNGMNWGDPMMEMLMAKRQQRAAGMVNPMNSPYAAMGNPGASRRMSAFGGGPQGGLPSRRAAMMASMMQNGGDDEDENGGNGNYPGPNMPPFGSRAHMRGQDPEAMMRMMYGPAPVVGGGGSGRGSSGFCCGVCVVM